MPALNFQARFADAVEQGRKLQTIRAPRRDGRAHCKPGDTLALYTGMRTKQCRLLRRATCTQVRQVRIEATHVVLDGIALMPTVGGPKYGSFRSLSDEEFACADGFDSFVDMLDWVRETHGLPFEGALIKWEETND